MFNITFHYQSYLKIYFFNYHQCISPIFIYFLGQNSTKISIISKINRRSTMFQFRNDDQLITWEDLVVSAHSYTTPTPTPTLKLSPQNIRKFWSPTPTPIRKSCLDRGLWSPYTGQSGRSWKSVSCMGPFKFSMKKLLTNKINQLKKDFF